MTGLCDSFKQQSHVSIISWKDHFIDTLFSAVELLATSQLLCISESKYVKKQSHPRTNVKYNSFIRIGNATSEFAKVLNKIWSLTDPARYCNGQLKLDWEDGLH